MSAIAANPLTPGTVLSGTVSWFGGPHDPESGPTTASGKPVSAGGIAVYNTATLGGFWRVTFPNGKTTVLQQTDLGPAPFTGRLIDVSYASLGAAGYTEADFPTNGRVRAEYLGKNPAAAAAPATTPGASPSSIDSSSSSGAPGGLTGILVKGLIYLALIGGALAMLWLGAKTFLQPRREAIA